MKGFSFIAVILIVSFAIVSGLAVYNFYTSLVKTSGASTEAEVLSLVECAGGLMNVRNVRGTGKKGEVVLLLPMDEGSGTIAYDHSNYGNNGTLLDANTTNADVISNVTERGILEKLIVQSKVCPNVKIEKKIGDVVV